MKKRHRSTIAATLFPIALLGIGALPALADPPNPPFTPGSLTNTLLQDAAAQSAGDKFALTVMGYSSGENDGQFFVGLTQGYITDLTQQTTSAAFYMFCVDFKDEINVPVTYDIVIEGLSGSDPTSIPDAGLGLSLQTLQTQSLLGAQFGTTPSLNSGLDTDIQHDIWNMSGGQYTPPTAGMTSALQTADLAYGAGQDYSGAWLFDVLANSQTNPNGPGQAFMAVDTTTGFNHSSEPPPVPEPGTLAMLGLGLIGLGSFKLRRTKR